MGLCKCGGSHWDDCVDIGVQDGGDGYVVILRNCTACGTTRGLEIPPVMPDMQAFRSATTQPPVSL